jgi:hypothetical protein
MKKIILTFITIYSVFFATACPTKAEIDTAIKYSSQMSRVTEFASSEMELLCSAQIITPEMLDSVKAKLVLVAEGNSKFLQLLNAIRDAGGGKITALTREQKSSLDVFFNANVILHFTELLNETARLPADVAKKILIALSAVKAAILAISLIFERGSLSYKFYMREQYTV